MHKTRLPDQITVNYHYLFVQNNIRIRYGVITCPRTPVNGIFLLLHGRSEFIEKYKGVASLLLEKNFHVISLDWRGQGLSSRELENRHKGYIKQFDAYADDFSLFYSTVIEPQGLPVYILAHSMGGHIALKFMAKYPAAIKKAILVSPMIDIALPGMVKGLARYLAGKMAKHWLAEKYAPGSGDYVPETVRFEKNVLSHDKEGFWILHHEIAKNPDLALGGVTWGWLNAAFESIEQLKQRNTIEKIVTPVLMISAENDSVVCSNAQKKMIGKLTHGTFVSIKGGFHELLFETREIKTRVWQAINAFLEG